MARALTFVLPKLLDHAVGGYKVHYQYANGLAERGWSVTLVHPITDAARPTVRDRLLAVRASHAQGRPPRPPIGWFDFHPSVRSVVVPALTAASLPAADATVLTAWQTAARTLGAPARAGTLLQVVYDYEFWVEQPDRRTAIRQALGRPDVDHVATSGVVASMLREIGAEPIATVTAGLDPSEFAVDVPVAERAHVVGFARRFQPSKDLTTAIRAIERIRDRVPDAEFVCFGGARGHELPSFVEDLGTVSRAELRRFYNRCSVFLLTSRVEGWGLPALEAMACGAAVVSTRSGGVEDFLVDGVTGVLAPVGDAEAVADAASGLLCDDARRTQLATRGADEAATHTLDASVTKLEEILIASVGTPR